MLHKNHFVNVDFDKHYNEMASLLWYSLRDIPYDNICLDFQLHNHLNHILNDTLRLKKQVVIYTLCIMSFKPHLNEINYRVFLLEFNPLRWLTLMKYDFTLKFLINSFGKYDITPQWNLDYTSVSVTTAASEQTVNWR